MATKPKTGGRTKGTPNRPKPAPVTDPVLTTPSARARARQRS